MSDDKSGNMFEEVLNDSQAAKKNIWEKITPITNILKNLLL